MTPASSGFTLVELAISLMVIGLLIGGVLKGQELVNNARVTQTIRQFKAYDAAIEIFQGTYNALPGDIKNPAARIPNCTSAPCNVTGNGNGKINDNGVVEPEGRNLWLHLSKAGLITGIDNSYTGTPNTEGVDFPTVVLGGLMSSVFINGSANGNRYMLSSTPVGGYSVPLRRLGEIDRKIDDGKAMSGDVYTADCSSNGGYEDDYSPSDPNEGADFLCFAFVVMQI